MDNDQMNSSRHSNEYVSVLEHINTVIGDLKCHFKSRYDDLRHYTDMRLREMEKASKVALKALNKRLATMNEFRKSIEDLQSHLVGMDVFLAFKEQTHRDIKSISDEQHNFVGRPEFISFKDNVLRDIDSLNLSRAETKGMAKQSSVIQALIFSIISLVIGLIGTGLGVISIIKELGTK